MGCFDDFYFNSDADIRGGERRSAIEASPTSCPTLPVPKFQLRPSLQLWNVSNGTNQLQSEIDGVGIARRRMRIDSSRTAAGAILARAIVVTNASGDQR